MHKVVLLMLCCLVSTLVNAMQQPFQDQKTLRAQIKQGADELVAVCRYLRENNMYKETQFDKDYSIFMQNLELLVWPLMNEISQQEFMAVFQEIQDGIDNMSKALERLIQSDAALENNATIQRVFTLIDPIKKYTLMRVVSLRQLYLLQAQQLCKAFLDVAHELIMLVKKVEPGEYAAIREQVLHE
ncbi:hypothetical protein FJ364_00985 [Candidatus Dependentiae bacterium]|nr:hypothetical protein [Candidatus Dependentiae bacterium]